MLAEEISRTKYCVPQQEYQMEPLLGFYGKSFNIYYIVDRDMLMNNVHGAHCCCYMAAILCHIAKVKVKIMFSLEQAT
jgi:hypothetical protein